MWPTRNKVLQIRHVLRNFHDVPLNYSCTSIFIVYLFHDNCITFIVLLEGMAEKIGTSVTDFIVEELSKREEFEDEPFIVTNLSEIQDRYEKWTAAFPGIQAFFALKAQHNAFTLKLLAGNGCGFDVASICEIKDALAAGAKPENILYGQPYKQPSHLAFALQQNLLSVCDTVDEIRKVGDVSKKLNLDTKPRILIRILPDDKEGDIKGKLSSKFGAPFSSLSALAKAAFDNGIAIVGISFHVGSHCHSAQPYLNTLQLSRSWWDELENTCGCNLSILDIGGGYPGERNSKFEEMAAMINESVSSCYSDVKHKIRIIAEPGRYMVTSSQAIIANVIADKSLNDSFGSFVLNTGVYGGLSSSMCDKTAARASKPYIIRRNKVLASINGSNGNDQKRRKLCLWGPTCDSSDKLVDGYELEDIRRGDWIVFPDLGAYGSNIMTTFNGFQKPQMLYVFTDLHADIVDKILG